MTYTDATTLVEFLRARLDEREQAAQAATRGPWWAVGTLFPEEGSHAEEMLRGYVDGLDAGEVTKEDIKGADAWHIALNDPSAVLADVEAKRRIVDDLYAPKLPYDHEDSALSYVHARGWNAAVAATLRLLALPYADHPDYDPSWRPAEVTA